MSLLDGKEERSLKDDKKAKKECVFIDGRKGREYAFMSTNKQKRVQIHSYLSPNHFLDSHHFCLSHHYLTLTTTLITVDLILTTD